MKLRVDSPLESVNSIQNARFVWNIAHSVTAHNTQHEQQQQQHCNNDWLPFENLCVSGEKETTNRRSKLINHFRFRFRWLVYSSLFLLHAFRLFYFVRLFVPLSSVHFFPHSSHNLRWCSFVLFSCNAVKGEKMNVCLICLAHTCGRVSDCIDCMRATRTHDGQKRI